MICTGEIINNSAYHSLPCSRSRPGQNAEHREQSVKDKCHADEPPDTDHSQLAWFREKSEQECYICKSLKESLKTKIRDQIENDQKGKERKYACRPLFIESGKVNLFVQHALMVTAAHAERGYHHKEVDKLSKPRNNTFSEHTAYVILVVAL